MGTETNLSVDQSGKNAASEDVATFRQDENKIPEVVVTNLLIPNRDEFEKKFVRKLDLRLLPLMMLICMYYANCIMC
jgi:hypothetical protein